MNEVKFVRSLKNPSSSTKAWKVKNFLKEVSQSGVVRVFPLEVSI